MPDSEKQNFSSNVLTRLSGFITLTIVLLNFSWAITPHSRDVSKPGDATDFSLQALAISPIVSQAPPLEGQIAATRVRRNLAIGRMARSYSSGLWNIRRLRFQRFWKWDAPLILLTSGPGQLPTWINYRIPRLQAPVHLIDLGPSGNDNDGVATPLKAMTRDEVNRRINKIRQQLSPEQLGIEFIDSEKGELNLKILPSNLLAVIGLKSRRLVFRNILTFTAYAGSLYVAEMPDEVGAQPELYRLLPDHSDSYEVLSMDQLPEQVKKDLNMPGKYLDPALSGIEPDEIQMRTILEEVTAELNKILDDPKTVMNWSANGSNRLDIPFLFKSQRMRFNIYDEIFLVRFPEALHSIFPAGLLRRSNGRSLGLEITLTPKDHSSAKVKITLHLNIESGTRPGDYIGGINLAGEAEKSLKPGDYIARASIAPNLEISHSAGWYATRQIAAAS